MPASQQNQLRVRIDKLIHGGQGIGTLDDGRKALVWNTIPGEVVEFTLRKSRSSFVEGVAEHIIEPSSERIEPKDELYLSTSPWQIMTYEAENRHKQSILEETFHRQHVRGPTSHIEFTAPEEHWHYRNKMEYSFYGDEDGLHLALYNRGTHRKQVVAGSSLARPEIDEIANKLVRILNEQGTRASDLKSMIIRCDKSGKCVVALFTRDRQFSKIEDLTDLCKGIAVVYSNPKSPASVRTKNLYQFGDISLTDEIMSKDISYDVFSFFQVNLPIFHQSLKKITKCTGSDPVQDFYGGVGAIGLSLPTCDLIVESDLANAAWAERNAIGKVRVERVSSENALDYINDRHALVVDPPRAGLHKDMIDRIIDVKPPKVVYLSCNPSTQARDLEILQQTYTITSLTGYNFFPRTPHIESLAILERS